MYAIIDVETTGTSAIKGKITEIAIILHNGTAITESYTTLINPECPIPYQITRLTGISDSMVEKAPKFFEVAKRIIELTAGRTFVAHNALFDYAFIREEFRRLGYSFRRKTLCTVQLSRKLIPGHRSYSLGNICYDLGIELNDRHRAYGDALATTLLFDKLLQQQHQNASPLFASANQILPREKVESIPEATGVYYFYDAKGEIIYIGKSKNIANRVKNHLGHVLTPKAIRMRDQIADCAWEITGSELVALLLESAEIKKHKPIFNRKLRRTSFTIGLFKNEDSDGYIHLALHQIGEDEIPLTTFQFMQQGVKFLHQLVEDHRLCNKLCHLETVEGGCSRHQLRQCQGACTGSELAMDYNQRVLQAIKPLQFRSPNFFILEDGRERDECAIVKIANGSYQGYGYLAYDQLVNDDELLHDCIRKQLDNRDIRTILKQYLNQKKGIKIWEFTPE